MSASPPSLAANHRASSALALTVLLVVTAGCSGTLVEVAASPATIPDDPLEAAGYDHATTTEVPVTYPVGPSVVAQNLTTRTWVSAYVKSTDGNDTAVLVLYSSPNVEVAGTSVNPLGQLSNRELVRFVLDRVGDLRTLGGVEQVTDLRIVGEREVSMLNTTTRFASYAGTAVVDDRRVDVVVNVAVVEHGGDVVVAVGLHEATMAETGTQAALLEDVVHEE